MIFRQKDPIRFLAGQNKGPIGGRDGSWVILFATHYLSLPKSSLHPNFLSQPYGQLLLAAMVESISCLVIPYLSLISELPTVYAYVYTVIYIFFNCLVSGCNNVFGLGSLVVLVHELGLSVKSVRFWRVYCQFDGLHVMRIFFGKSVPRAPSAPFVKLSESVEHILFRCWTRAVWFGSSRSFWVLDGIITAADKWVFELLFGILAKESPNDVIALIFQLFWAIWKGRNDFVFKGTIPNPENVLSKANFANADYLDAVFSGVKSATFIPSRSGGWNPPPLSVFKVNCDGAYSSSRCLATFGIDVRDGDEIAQLCRCGKAKGSLVVAIKAWVLRIACGMMLELDFPEVIYETDCKMK